MEQIWNALLDLMARFVTPDWGALVALLPLGILAIVLLFLVWTASRATSLGPRRRGPGRVRPRPPEGIHAPGPSLAPVAAALGAALVMYGLVFGGFVIALGGIALVLALVYWLREAIHEFDHVAGTVTTLPAIVHLGPPPGVHMPGPSFRPFLVAIAVTVLMYGLVFGGWLLPFGLLMLAVSMLGWLRDARTEYRLVERADATGHLENAPAPSVPVRTLAVFAGLFVLGIVLNAGILPPRSAGGTAGGSAAPGGSAAASAVAADVSVSASNLQFSTKELTAPAGRAFTLAFDNRDAGVPHNVAIHKDSPTGQEVFKGAIFSGPAVKVYNVPALAAGTYAFVCSVHANMTGTLTVK